jgi:hypothetical protein
MSEAIFDMRPVSSLATYLNGYPFKPEDHDVEGVPVVRIAQLNDPTAEMDYFKGDVPKRNHIDDGDLIFSWSGSLCVRVWDRGPAYLNQHLFNVLPAEGVDKRWLKWILTHAIEHFHPYMHGSAMTHITKPMMTAVRVPTPSIEEQRRIADFLDDQVGRIDQAIEHINAQRVLLTEARLAQVNELTSHINGERLRMKWLFSESDERIGYEPDARELLSVSIHRGVVPRHEISEDEARADSLANYKVVRKGDLVLNRMRAFQGGVGVAYVQGVCSPDYAVLRPSAEISSAYLRLVGVY